MPKKDFESDLLAVMAELARVSAKHDLPAPTVLFPSHWRAPILQTESYARQHRGGLCGVEFDFGVLCPGRVVL